ncbi:hypothetical protein GCM10023198_26160 [Promicromonospora umidemergens]|uniref:Uncharacterized protein n=1 Tax=Promicromonospora umidemergens TaxID=629679 RepID=A0ABP8XCQ8_9MICO
MPTPWPLPEPAMVHEPGTTVTVKFALVARVVLNRYFVVMVGLTDAVALPVDPVVTVLSRTHEPSLNLCSDTVAFALGAPSYR